MTNQKAKEILRENFCMMCAYGEHNIDECNIRECDSRDAAFVAIEAIEQLEREKQLSKFMHNYGFHLCYFKENEIKLTFAPQDRPEDGFWLWWYDKNGQKEFARMKIDAEDHFYPNTKIIKEEDVIGWSYDPELHERSGDKNDKP